MIDCWMEEREEGIGRFFSIQQYAPLAQPVYILNPWKGT